MNKTIKKFLDENKLSNDEYSILFEDKSDYNSEQRIYFSKLLKKIIDLHQGMSHLNLSYIYFPDFDFKTYDFNTFEEIRFEKTTFENHLRNADKYIFKVNMYFSDATFKTHVSFDSSTFYGIVHFDRAKFLDGAKFNKAIFENNIYFRWSKFKKIAYFENTHFKKITDFTKADFYDTAYFDHAIFEDLTYFERARFQNLTDFQNAESSKYISFAHIQLWINGTFSLHNSRFEHASYLNIIQTNGFSVTSKHLANKETARLIKAEFEKQKNVTESNKYFEMEQKHYFKELIKDGWYNNLGGIISVGLHRLISKSGTSWGRVLFWILIFSILVLYFKDGIPHNYETLLNVPNRAIELINPLNVFKKDYNLYDGQEFWAMLVRIITIYLFYQFTMAFRQNTRRK